MIDHQRRFSFPIQPTSESSVAVVPPALNRNPPPAMSPMEMLARIYAMAYEQARESMQRRQWDELLDLLFNSQS